MSHIAAFLCGRVYIYIYMAMLPVDIDVCYKYILHHNLSVFILCDIYIT